MEALATRERAWVWVCPECGHGSPEPRDRQAHLDAHRQLTQFLDTWDARATADRVAERRRRRRPVVYAVAAVVLVLLAALGVRMGRRHDVVPPTASGPVPAVEPPAPSVEPPAPAPPSRALPATPPPGGGPARPPAVGPRTPSAGPPRPPVEVPAPPAGTDAVSPPTVSGAPAAPPGGPGPQGAGAPAPPDVSIDTCLLHLCLGIRMDLPLLGSLGRP